jgi:hypothetical protein
MRQWEVAMKVLLPSFDIAGVPAHRPTVFPGRADRRASNVIRVAILALITVVLAVLICTRVFDDPERPDITNHNRIAGTQTVDGLHIALPSNVRHSPVEQLVPSP